MLYFPQLLTGAVAQYPLRRKRRSRTVVNLCPGGDEVKLADPEEEWLEWELHLAGLTDAEWAAVEELFHQCEGGLGTFCFLDPSGNLLRWSGDLEQTVWQKDPLLAVQGGATDPFGGSRGTRLVNLAQTEQTISQALDVPARYWYCFSGWARSSSGARVWLKQWCTGGAEARVFEVGGSWSRLEHTANLGGPEERVHFGLTVPAGAAVEIYGFQVEPQRGASPYKETGAQSGVYRKARFASDELRVRTEGAEDHASVVRIAVNLKQS